MERFIIPTAAGIAALAGVVAAVVCFVRKHKREESSMAKSKLVKVNEKIAENVVGGYKKIEETVVGGYKKIEDGVVGGFNRMSDHFVDQFLTKEGETVEQAKQRLAKKQQEREHQ